MLQKIKKAFSKKVKRLAVAFMAVITTSAVLAIGAFAADSTESSSNMASIVNTAGTTLQEEFTAMVNSLVPVLIAIAMVGLGMYAIIYLFKMAKKMFAKAAG